MYVQFINNTKSCFAICLYLPFHIYLRVCIYYTTNFKFPRVFPPHNPCFFYVVKLTNITMLLSF